MADLEKFIILIKQRNYDQAIDELEKFIKKNKTNLKALDLLVLSYQYNNNFSMSLKIYKKSLKINNSFKTYDRMGEVCIKNNNFELAKKYFNISLSINEENPITQNNLGLVLAHLNHELESIQHFKKSIELNPEYKEPLYNLLEIYEKTNMLTELKELASFSMQKFRSNQIIKFYYALILEKQNHLNQANTILENINFIEYSADWDIKKTYQLGKINDALKNYSKAFNYFNEANKKSLNLIGKNLLTNNIYMAKVDQYLKQSYSNFSPKKKIQTTTNINAKHFFLIGFPRSGTTLLDTILRSHQDILVVEEKPIVQKMIANLSSLDKLENIKEHEVKNLSTIYFSELSKIMDIKSIYNKILIDKFPLNIIESRLIHLIFPHAKFIFSVRHPLDCVLSCFMQNFQINQAMTNFLDIEITAKIYDKIMQIWLNYKEISRNSVYQIKYENLTHHFEKTLINLIEFMEINWNKDLLNFNETAVNRERIRTPSYTQVTQPIYTSSSFRWLNYKNELKLIRPILDKWIKYFNYE